MVSVKIILRNDKTNQKNGLAPLYIRIIKDRTTKFISMGIKIDPKFWNEDKMCLRKGAQNYHEINNYIIQKRGEIEKTSIDLEANYQNVTSSLIKSRIKGNKVSFFEYSDKKIEQLKHKLSYASIEAYKMGIGKFERFFGSRNLKFEQIDINLLKEYEKHLYEVLKNNSVTVVQAFKVLKLIFNYAINDEVISGNLYPFKAMKIKLAKANKNYLNEEQFKSLLEFDTLKLNGKAIYYDMFLFSCYAGGLRFSDVIDLKWQDYIESEQRIVKLIRKTNRKHQFKLPSKAIEIIAKYKSNKKEPNHFIFPILRNGFDYSLSPKHFSTMKIMSNQSTNKILHEIGEDLKLPFTLTFHTSRHTFATRALNKGMRIEHVSKILDHSNISTTQIYAKIINKELDKAMEIMED